MITDVTVFVVSKTIVGEAVRLWSVAVEASVGVAPVVVGDTAALVKRTTVADVEAGVGLELDVSESVVNSMAAVDISVLLGDSLVVAGKALLV